ncbi:hypothetical protein LYSHEL_26950 [Lysobacter helvus]|uniref:Uncharacterized protein n=2 Tax=Lysobacteraceae TaxID=32033 RepID=A0ABN6FVK2_9GAMM|nr:MULTISPECIES: hypothetical protein [Lysobacter]BCT93668.1 hypothetical protein LYSCAS_26920 [Lysobacter caseinilyticus]BCT96824.1 hypothetical protein LYSHEL_26950 [Lysobacter helvus]
MATRDYQETDRDVLAELPLERLNAEISRCLLGYQTGGSSQGRKAFFKRLVMLEDIREQAHGVPAKQRTFSSR